MTDYARDYRNRVRCLVGIYDFMVPQSLKLEEEEMEVKKTDSLGEMRANVDGIREILRCKIAHQDIVYYQGKKYRIVDYSVSSYCCISLHLVDMSFPVPPVELYCLTVNLNNPALSFDPPKTKPTATGDVIDEVERLRYQLTDIRIGTEAQLNKANHDLSCLAKKIRGEE